MIITAHIIAAVKHMTTTATDADRARVLQAVREIRGAR